jgi:phosphatidylglycerophosphate synthase
MTPRARPSLAELRAVAQPAATMARYNAEHWAGALYMRHLSLHLTRVLIPTGITANGVTVLMILTGVIGAACLLLPGLWGPVLVAVAMQLQILLDCSDGEVARWRGTSSPSGIYLDRIGHYLTEAALPIALGLRADGVGVSGDWSPGGWTTLGLCVAVVVLLNKAFTDLVHVARAAAKRPPLADTPDVATSRRRGVARVRQAVGHVPFFRAFVAVEASLLALAAGVVDVVAGDRAGTQALVAVSVPLVVVTAGGHLLGVLTSSRLR